MKSDWTQSFATAGLVLIMFNELENLEISYKNEEISQEAYETRKSKLERMLDNAMS